MFNLNDLGSIEADDGKCDWEIKRTIRMAEDTFLKMGSYSKTGRCLLTYQTESARMLCKIHPQTGRRLEAANYYSSDKCSECFGQIMSQKEKLRKLGRAASLNGSRRDNICSLAHNE